MEFKHGAVVRGVVNGEPVIAIRDQNMWHYAITSFAGFSGGTTHSIQDPEPLVVLDIDDHRAAVAQLRGRGDTIGYWNGLIAEQIEAQSGRIEEPSLYGIVKARTPDSGRLQLRLVRTDERYPLRWQPMCMNYSQPLAWDDLIDPVLVRAGMGDQ